MTQARHMPFLSVRDVWKSYPARRPLWPWKKHALPVLRGVCLTLEKGSIVGLLGESGSGKSTLARLLLGLESPDSGHILLEGLPVGTWRKLHRGKLSVVFQDYMTSVNPGFTVGEIIAEGFRAAAGVPATHGDIREMMERVELPARLATRLPHQLSGGQVQRVCIARALASRPDFIILDEAVSALDVSVQTEIVNLLKKLKGDAGYLFITHDIQIAAMLCDKILILHHGRIADEGDMRHLGESTSPYLRKMLSSTIIFRSPFKDDIMTRS